MPDIERIRREGMRWNILNTLNKARPYTTSETFVLSVMRSLYPDATAMEIRRELDYLADRELVELNKTPHGAWYADITRCGVDVAEYTVEVSAGIDRPLKLWDN